MEFVFRKEQRSNQEKAAAGRPHVKVRIFQLAIQTLKWSHSYSFTRFIMSTLLSHFEQVAWEEGSDTVWRTTEAGMEEEDLEV